MNGKAVVILLLIITSLIPAYILYNYLQKVIRPRESLGRLLVYLLLGFLLVFMYTFLLVFIVKILFPGA